MSESKKLVVMITRGFDDERASVGWSVANAGVASGLEVTVFLASSGVDWVRRGAAEMARLNPLDPPMKDMITAMLASGGSVLVCPPCAGVRGYAPDDLLDGVTVAGASAMHELIRSGAATLSV